MKKLYWVSNQFEGSDIITAYSAPRTSEAHNWEGPFKTLTAAKRCALRYHRTTVHVARLAMQSVRLLRKEDIHAQN